MAADSDEFARVPAEVDLDKPSAARIYDWYLGGDQNWAIDREFGRRIEELWPHARQGSWHNRQFMNRAVRAALDAGVRQFIDLGSGVPTVGNVHEVVREHLPGQEPARVVYVDYEPVAAAHGRMILERDGATDWAALVQQDMRQPTAILDDPETRRLIDFTRPVCVLMIAVLHFVGSDEGPHEITRGYLDRVPDGSWLALSHMTEPDEPDAAAGVRRFAEQYRDTTTPVTLRSRPEISSFFGGLTVLEPGVTHLTDWRSGVEPDELLPSDSAARPFAWCGVAEKSSRG